VPTPLAFDTALGGPRRNIAMTFGVEKLEWCGYPMMKNFVDMFIHFDRVYEHDGRTDGQTPHDGIVHAYAQHLAIRNSNWASQRPNFYTVSYRT